MSDVPRIVWLLWLQGWAEAPPLVRACAESWTERNPGWDVRCVDSESVASWLPDLRPQDELSPAAYSDLVRVQLLRHFGGVWADATTYCWISLDDWVADPFRRGFFAFRRRMPGRVISSWFLASAPQHPITAGWADAVDAYWQDRARPDKYFWLHQLYTDLLQSRPDLRREWEEVPAISARGPHYFVPYGKRLTDPMNALDRAQLSATGTPLYKLTHKVDYDTAGPDSALGVFLDRGSHRAPTSWVPRGALKCVEAGRWTVRDTLIQSAALARRLHLRS